MSSSHLTLEMVDGFRARTLGADELLAVSEHLAECGECRAQVAPQGMRGKLVEALAGDQLQYEHLAYEGLEAIVRGGREGLEHVAVCGMCAAELNDLRVFRAGQGRPARASRGTRILVPAGVFAMAALALMAVFLRTGQKPASVRVAPAAPAALSDSLHDGGGVVGLNRVGMLSGLEGLSAEEGAQIAEALRSGRITVAAPERDLLRSREILLGGPDLAVVLTPEMPTGTVVLANRPVFRWQAAGGPGSFQVKVYDANFDLVMVSPKTGAREWNPDMALVRGKSYSWTVSGVVNGAKVTAPHAPEPEARFRVATAAEAGQMEAGLRAVPVSDLRVAVIAARLGLRDDAREALRRLEARNPGSALAAQLRTSVEAAPAK